MIKRPAFFLKLSVMAVLLAFLCTLGFQPEGAGAAAEARQLTLEECIDLALQNNPQVKLAELGRDKAAVTLRQARDTARGIDLYNPPSYVLGVQSAYDLAKLKLVVPRQAQSAMDIAETVYATRINGLKVSVEKNYYDLIKARRSVVISQDKLQRAQEQLRIAKTRFDVGTTARSEVLDAETRVAQAEAALITARSQDEVARVALNQVIGLPEDTPVVPVTEFTFEESAVDLAAAIDEALRSDLSVIQARENSQTKQYELEVAANYYPSNVPTYKLAEIANQEAQLNLTQAEDALRLRVRQAHSNLLAAGEQVKVLEKSLEMARENARLASLRYEYGLGTSIESMNASGALAETEAAYLEALYNYNLAKSRFKYNIFS